MIFTEMNSRKRRGLRKLRDNVVSGISQIGSLFIIYLEIREKNKTIMKKLQRPGKGFE